ncbi:uncharacterized protein BcabD6B2_57770 [Babesia caballi]|uniref:Uncharacterized protein n=1 Tax=Babesia caballi TaxID=5871 RepID=A0AAV4M4R3_BABCB|nr:hypothetical protein, conserved [Babesia caballi]
MSRRSRRRSRSRDSRRRSYGRSSYGSYSRSRSFSKPRRHASRDRRSLSRGRDRSTEYKRSSSPFRDRKRHSEEHSSVVARPSKWGPPVDTEPREKSSAAAPVNVPYRAPVTPRPRHRFQPRLPRGANKYESEDFRAQRMQKLEEVNQQRNEMLSRRQESQRQLADLTAQLNGLVARLALLPKDAQDREEVSQQIQDVRFAMKQLQMNKAAAPNKIDNRETKVLIRQLPACAQGPGKLASWIAANAAVLQPKHIAMLAAAPEGAVIEYKNHAIAEMVRWSPHPTPRPFAELIDWQVMRSCKLHGIDVAWAASCPAAPPRPAADAGPDVDYNLL